MRLARGYISPAAHAAEIERIRQAIQARITAAETERDRQSSTDSAAGCY